MIETLAGVTMDLVNIALDDGGTDAVLCLITCCPGGEAALAVNQGIGGEA